MNVSKKRAFISIIIIFLIALALALSYFIYFENYNLPQIKEILNSNLDFRGLVLPISILVLGAIWFITLVFLGILTRSLKKISKVEKIKETYHLVKKMNGKAQTELDTLYSLLKEHNKMKLKEIEKTFSITSDKALEWAKILENNNLLDIEYPAFSDPIIKLKEEKKEQ